MERHAFAMKIKEGQMNTYRRKLGEIWPELTALLDRNGITNFSIWNAEDLIFGYYENKDDLDWITDAISEDGSSLIIRVGDSTTVSSIGTDTDRRIYRTENILVYYDGGDSEVCTILEELYGRPIADGNLTENSSL